MKRGIIILALLLFTLIVPLSAQAQEEASWTIIYYSAADNDLESFLIGDLIEMQVVSSTDQVNIVVQVDRAEGYDTLHGDWTDARRFLLAPAQGPTSFGDFEILQETFLNTLRGIDADSLGISQAELDEELLMIAELSRPEFEEFAMSIMGAPSITGQSLPGLQQEALESIGEVDSGDPETLIDFALWAIENFPAERYALFISNHGGGWSGVAFDESHDNNALTLRELDFALEEIVGQSGIGKLDVVAFDACLMAQLEVLLVVEPYAHFIMAAQETIPGAGWEYISWLEALTQDPSLDVPDWGAVAVDGYMHYYTEIMSGYPAYDLHVFDTSQLGALVTALDDFATAVAANPSGNLRPIGNARANTQIFGADDPITGDYLSSADLIHFMSLLIQLTDDVAVQAAAQAVIDAAGNVRVYGRASDGLPGANGIAIYFPPNVRVYGLENNNVKYSQQSPTGMASWQTFLDVFHGTATTTFVPGQLTIELLDVLPSDGTASIWDPPVVIFAMDGEGIVDLQFFAALDVGEGIQVILDQSPLEFTVYTPDGQAITGFPEGYSVNEFTWNVEMPVLTDGTNSVPVLLIGAQDSSQVVVQGQYTWANGVSAEAHLSFDLETRQFISAWAVESNPQSQAIAEVRPQRGDRFEPYWSFLNDEGEMEYYPSGTTLVFGATPFTYEFQPAPSGDYLLAMWAQDMAGNIAFDVVPFAVDSEELDTAYRGFKDIQTGVNFLFPWDWSDPEVTVYDDDTFTLSVTSPDGSITIFVNTWPDVTSQDELVGLALGALEAFEATAYEPEAYTLPYYDTIDGTLIYYEYHSEDGTERVGGLLAIFVEELAMGYFIDLDTTAETEDTGVEVYQVILDSIFFFEPYVFPD